MEMMQINNHYDYERNNKADNCLRLDRKLKLHENDKIDIID